MKWQSVVIKWRP